MIELKPARVDARVSVPGSKYVANRVLFIAALARGESLIYNLPDNEDVATAAAGLTSLGVSMHRRPDGALAVTGLGGKLPSHPASVYTAGSGTFSRFLLPFAALGASPVEITANAKMSTRPMVDLFQALRQLGVRIDAPGDHLPAKVQGPLTGGAVSLRGDISSQYFSALMLSGITTAGLTVTIVGDLVSRPFVDLTTNLMAKAGVTVDLSRPDRIVIPGGQVYQGRTWHLEPDPVSASYFMAAAALTGGRVTIPGYVSDSPQGEAAFPKVLARMGCTVLEDDSGLTVTGPADGLKSVEAPMGDMPDVVQTLAVLAAFAKGTTRITGIRHLQFKESDRIHETAEELAKLGVAVKASEDRLEITGGPVHGGTVDGRGDHRMAMSLCLAGLLVPGVKLTGENAVGKSFPDYFDRLAAAGVSVLRTAP